MDEGQKTAYMNAQVACAMIEMQGMVAENLRRQIEMSDSPLYVEADFARLINKYGIHHNAVITWFHS